MRTVDEILGEALALPREQRAELLRRLADSIPPDDLDPALLDELSALADRIESGQEPTRSWVDVREQIFDKTSK